MIKAIIFDCFGVVISDALSVLCAELEPDNPAAITEIWSLIDQTNRGQMTPDESSARIADIFGLSFADYRQKLAEGEIKDQTLLSYILELRQSHKTAMLSNVGAGSLSRRFDAGELEKYFDIIVASGEIGYAKPEAQAYEITADRLGVRLEECVFIDDRQDYVEGAIGVGMRTILYKNLSQLRPELEKLLLANS